MKKIYQLIQTKLLKAKTLQCNYSNNYYGDQICRWELKTAILDEIQ
jgi:hypothetical protein